MKKTGSGSSSVLMFPDEILFSIRLRHLTIFCCGLPAFGFLTCVFLAVYLHFDGSTKTHCGVPNYLPSISAAIGDFTPERYIWRICIALHCLPRFMAAISYKNFYFVSPFRPTFDEDRTCSSYSFLCWLVCLLHMAENACLIALSFVSSTENHDFHEMSFIAFTVFAQIYMVMTLYMFNHSGRRRNFGEKSYQTKMLLFIINVVALLISVYFFIRHNQYCESGVYTLFALCEYLVVLSNIGFHSTIALDMSDKILVFTSASNVGLKYS